MSDPRDKAIQDFMEEVARQLRKIIVALDKLDKRITTLEEAERKSFRPLISGQS